MEADVFAVADGVKASAPEESRTPRVISPTDLIFASVSLACAKAVPQASAVSARAITCFFAMGSCRRGFGCQWWE